MTWLGFILECAATAALVGAAVGMLAVGCALAARPLGGAVSAAARSDLWLLLGLVPALAAVSMVAAAAAPSVGSVLDLRPDHCPGHGHHFHICFIHSSGLRPALATIGAFALATWVHRLGALLKGLIQSSDRARRLERLGRVRSGAFPLVVVPGSKLCHATGLFRRRIMLSSDLAGGLAPEELASAIAHEEAHLRRRDPLAGFLLAAAGLFVPPPLAAWFRRQHRQAAEEACDAAAAAAVGDGAVVAGALIKVAALQRHDAGVPAFAAPAFGTHALERRVKALLEGPPRQSRSHWAPLALLASASFAALTWTAAESLHHAVETVLGRLF